MSNSVFDIQGYPSAACQHLYSPVQGRTSTRHIESGTCFLASSSSTDMASTFSRLSLLLKRLLRSLLTCSPN